MVHVPGTAVRLSPPRGFTSTTRFPGFEDPDREASIAVTELPVPVDAVAADWTAEKLSTRGLVVAASARVGDRIRVKVREDAWTGPVVKLLLAIGSGQRTAILVATAPVGDDALMNELDAALATAEFDPASFDPLEGLPFRFDAASGLGIAARTGSMVLLTEGGAVGKGDDEPMLTIGAFPAEGLPDDLGRFARERLDDVVQLVEVEILQEEAAMVGGHDGWEVVARALRGPERSPVGVYVLAASQDGARLVVTGIVGAARAEWLEAFQRVGRSVRW